MWSSIFRRLSRTPAEVLRHIGSPFAPDKDHDAPLSLAQAASSSWKHIAKLADACVQRDGRVVELEAKLTELEPYRTFVEQVRLRVRQEEYGGDASPSS